MLVPSFCQTLFAYYNGTQKCITEDILNNAMTVGKYHVVNPTDGHPIPDTHKITIRVTSPHGNHYHYADEVDTGNFAFTAAEGGDYMTCFWGSFHQPPINLSIDFEWKTGIVSKDWANIAKKGHIEFMEIELKKLLDVVSSIHDEMFYLRDREEEMQALNSSTNSKMATFGFLSILVCLSVAGLQIWHLKNFFESKKLL